LLFIYSDPNEECVTSPTPMQLRYSYTIAVWLSSTQPVTEFGWLCLSSGHYMASITIN